MKSKTIKIVKRKKYRTSNIVDFEMMRPRTAEEISTYLSQYLDGVTPSIVRKLWKTGEMAYSRWTTRSNYLYADDYVEDLMRKEDDKKKKRKELEKKHGRF